MSIFRPFDPTNKPEFVFTDKIQDWELQYLHQASTIMNFGDDRIDRTNEGTRSLFSRQIRIDLKKEFPVVTTKKLAWRAMLAELIWFLEGSGDERRLAEILHGTRDPAKATIWTDNAQADYWKPKAEYEGHLGRVYGVQWRSWRGADGTEIDQIQNVIDAINNDPYNRRMLVTAYNVGEIHLMALPPCHMMIQFYVRYDAAGNKYLSGKMYQRSADWFLGVPLNVTSYALLIHMIAKITGCIPDTLTMDFGDTHIYANHFKQIETQLSRQYYNAPTLVLPENVTTLSDFTMENVYLENYNHHPQIKAVMAV